MTLTLALITGGRQWVLDQLAIDPAWQRTRIKSPEGAAGQLVAIARRVALSEASALILPEIQGFWKDYSKKNGPRPEDPASEWYEGHDDGLLALFEPFAGVLSGSWLGFSTTDIRLWTEGEDEKLANSFAQEVWKQLTFGRTDNQILAGVGIVHDDLAQYGYMPPEPVKPPKLEYTQMSVNAILNRIMMNMPDPDSLREDLDFVSDTDDALAAGAIERLGIFPEDVAILRDAREASSLAVEAWFNAIEAGVILDETMIYADLEPQAGNASLKEALEGSLGPDPIASAGLPPLPPGSPVRALPPLPPLPGAGNGTKPPLPPLPPVAGTTNTLPTRGGKRTKTPEQPPPGYIALEILRSIKEHAGTKDEDMADLLGISRPTLANIMKGKGWYVPGDPSRRQAIMNMLATHVTKLTEAYEIVKAQ